MSDWLKLTICKKVEIGCKPQPDRHILWTLLHIWTFFVLYVSIYEQLNTSWIVVMNILSHPVLVDVRKMELNNTCLQHATSGNWPFGLDTSWIAISVQEVGTRFQPITHLGPHTLFPVVSQVRSAKGQLLDEDEWYRSQHSKLPKIVSSRYSLFILLIMKHLSDLFPYIPPRSILLAIYFRQLQMADMRMLPTELWQKYCIFLFASLANAHNLMLGACIITSTRIIKSAQCTTCT